MLLHTSLQVLALFAPAPKSSKKEMYFGVLESKHLPGCRRKLPSQTSSEENWGRLKQLRPLDFDEGINVLLFLTPVWITVV